VKTNQVLAVSAEEFAAASLQMKCVLTIICADEDLSRQCLPLIHIKTDSIEWDSIFGTSWGSGHGGAILWANALWCDEHREGSRSPFDAAFSMSPKLQKAILKGVAMRWGLMVS